MFVSCTSILLEQLYDHQKCTISLQKWFWIFKISLQNRSQETVPVCIVLQYYPHGMWWLYEINRSRRLSQALVHFVIDRASLFTDHKISGRPTLAKYKHFKTIWEHTCDNSPADFSSSSLEWWSSMQGVDTLWSCCVVLFANSQSRSTHFFAWSYHKTMEKYEDFEGTEFFLFSRWNSKFKHGSVIVHNIFASFTMSLSTSQENTI